MSDAKIICLCVLSLSCYSSERYYYCHNDSVVIFAYFSKYRHYIGLPANFIMEQSFLNVDVSVKLPQKTASCDLSHELCF